MATSLSAGGPSQAAESAGGDGRGTLEQLDLLERPARALRHAGEGRVRQPDWNVRLLLDALGEAAQQGAAAGKQDPALRQVGGELGRRHLQRRLYLVDDLRDGA